MLCLKWQEQLALYVEGDLSELESRAVNEHLHNCAACQQFFTELQQSQQLLKVFGQPDLDEAVFTQLRQAVLNKLVVSPQPRFWQRWFALLFPLWQWRNAMAMLALVALSVASYLAYYQLRASDNRTDLVKTTSPSKGESLVNKGVISSKATTQSTQIVAINQPKAPQRSLKTHSIKFNQAKALRGSREQVVTDSNTSAQANSKSEPFEDTAMPDISRNTPIKMEIQTSDPTIKIIWVANSSTAAESTKKSL